MELQKCALLYGVIVANMLPNNIPAEQNLFKRACSASRSQRHLTGPLLANSTETKTTFTLSSHSHLSLRRSKSLLLSGN